MSKNDRENQAHKDGWRVGYGEVPYGSYDSSYPKSSPLRKWYLQGIADGMKAKKEETRNVR